VSRQRPRLTAKVVRGLHLVQRWGDDGGNCGSEHAQEDLNMSKAQESDWRAASRYLEALIWWYEEVKP
jgi:hypothetical protein